MWLSYIAARLNHTYVLIYMSVSLKNCVKFSCGLLKCIIGLRKNLLRECLFCKCHVIWLEYVSLPVRVSSDDRLTSGPRRSSDVYRPPRAVAELKKAFDLSSEEFQKKYGCARPGERDPIILHCKGGVRAAKAAGQLTESGYSNLKSVPRILPLKPSTPVTACHALCHPRQVCHSLF